ncbi:hypothetical protein GCM10023107_66880 [Actinoplanes octamycinicus]
MIDRCDTMAVHASAPAGGVHGEARWPGKVEISFSSGCYGQISDSEVERRLAQVIQLLWTRYLERQRAVRAEFGVHEIEDDPVRDNVFRADRDRIVAVGQSDDGRVVVSAEGIHRWRVVVADGTVRVLTERDFRAAVNTAVMRLVADQARQVLELKGRVYG